MGKAPQQSRASTKDSRRRKAVTQGVAQEVDAAASKRRRRTKGLHVGPPLEPWNGGSRGEATAAAAAAPVQAPAVGSGGWRRTLDNMVRVECCCFVFLLLLEERIDHVFLESLRIFE